MPFVSRDGIRLFWRLDGAADRPPLVLLNAIGTDMSLWDRALPHLLQAFRLLRMDTRGHGASDAPEGDYSLAMLATDVAAVMDEAEIPRAAFAGVSLGGMVAMQLALDDPIRVSALALICTSAAMDSASWVSRIEAVRKEGTGAIADVAVDRFLSERFRASHSEYADSLKTSITLQSDVGYAGAGAAIRDTALADRIRMIAAPTLVVTGAADVSTPYPGHGEVLVGSIPSARHIELAGAHLPPIEDPAGLAAALRQFFLEKPEVAEAAKTLFEAGLVNRRRVLGDEWVDGSLANQTPFNSDFQSMITRTAWQEVWGRPGLDDRTRRLIVLAVTASLGRWEEFRLHVRAGLSLGGLTRDELKEALMQIAIYAGAPAANTGFVEAGKIIADLEKIPDA